MSSSDLLFSRKMTDIDKHRELVYRKLISLANSKILSSREASRRAQRSSRKSSTTARVEESTEKGKGSGQGLLKLYPSYPGFSRRANIRKSLAYKVFKDMDKFNAFCQELAVFLDIPTNEKVRTKSSDGFFYFSHQFYDDLVFSVELSTYYIEFMLGMSVVDALNYVNSEDEVVRLISKFLMRG